MEPLFGLLLCLTCAWKPSPCRPSCCPHQRQEPLKGAVPIWIFPAQVRGETGQHEFSRCQEVLPFKKLSCCQSRRLPTCEAMQPGSCSALSSAEASGCLDASQGAAAPRSQHWPAHLCAIHGLSTPALLPDTLYSSKSAEQREESSLFPYGLFNLLSPLLSHSQPVLLAALLFWGWPRELCSPPISSLPWSKGRSRVSRSAHPQAPSWKVFSNSGSPTPPKSMFLTRPRI